MRGVALTLVLAVVADAGELVPDGAMGKTVRRLLRRRLTESGLHIDDVAYDKDWRRQFQADCIALYGCPWQQVAATVNSEAGII